MLIYPIWVLWQAKIPKEKLSINEKKAHLYPSFLS